MSTKRTALMFLVASVMLLAAGIGSQCGDPVKSRLPRRLFRQRVTHASRPTKGLG